jgi:DHA2 family multidrug resistance protein
MRTTAPTLIFKSWSPRWLIKVSLFLVYMPSLVLFFLPIANINAAAGFYGIEPADVQYLVFIYYAGFAGFFPLEKRFYRYFAIKDYFLLLTSFQIFTCLFCYFTRNLELLFICRFLQGMALAGCVSFSLNLVFNHIQNETARPIGFSVFFGTLLIIIPFDNLITADIIDAVNFNEVYKYMMFLFVPGLVMIGMLLNNVRLGKKVPLYALDWPSFIIYSLGICLFCFIMIYGQEQDWFEGRLISYAAAALVLLVVIFIARQVSLKRPLINPAVFKYPRLVIGAGLLIVLYICRFGAALTNTYFLTVLNFDPRNVSYINLLNIGGNIIGLIISCAMLIQKRPFRLIWIYGYFLVLIYYIWMCFLLSSQGNASTYYFPLVLLGIGIGMLMASILYFIITAVPPALRDTSSALCALFRCVAFCTSVALINYFDLKQKSLHYNSFRDNLSRANPLLKQSLQKQASMLIREGMQKELAAAASNKLLLKRVTTQDQIRFTMDYYFLIACLVLAVILILALSPSIKTCYIYYKTVKRSSYESIIDQH